MSEITARCTEVLTAEESLRRKILQLMQYCRNECTDDAETTLSGGAFQLLVVSAATGKISNGQLTVYVESLLLVVRHVIAELTTLIWLHG